MDSESEAENYHDEGMSLYFTNDYNKAKSCYSRVARLSPDSDQAYFWWGWSLFMESKYNLSINKLRIAVRLHPNNDVFYCALGTVYYQKGEYNEAILEFQKAIMLNPFNTGALNTWGLSLCHIERFDEAIEKFEKILDIDPLDNLVHVSWAFTLLEQGKFEQAIVKYSQANTLRPNNPVILRNWGLGLSYLQRYDEAIELYTTACEINPKDSIAYNFWGLTLYEQGKYEEAISKYRKAIEINETGDGGTTFLNWGLVLTLLDKNEEGKEMYTKGLKIVNQNPLSKIYILKKLEKERMRTIEHSLQTQDKTRKDQLEKQIKNINELSDFLAFEALDSFYTIFVENHKQISLQNLQINVNNNSKQFGPQFTKYYNLLYGHLNSIFARIFEVQENKRILVREDLLLSVVALANELVPSIWHMPNLSKVLPHTFAMAGPKFPDIFKQIQVRAKNRQYQQFILYFSGLKEIKQLVSALVEKLTLLRSEFSIHRGKNFQSLIVSELAQERFHKESKLDETEEMVLVDLSFVLILCFLEGIDENDKVLDDKSSIVQGITKKWRDLILYSSF